MCMCVVELVQALFRFSTRVTISDVGIVVLVIKLYMEFGYRVLYGDMYLAGRC